MTARQAEDNGAPEAGWTDPVATALLVLADGTVLEGQGLGAEGVGEAVEGRSTELAAVKAFVSGCWVVLAQQGVLAERPALETLPRFGDATLSHLEYLHRLRADFVW